MDSKRGPAGSAEWKQLARESSALVQCLRERNPCYLEHLQNRERLLRQLQDAGATGMGADLLALLRESSTAGELAMQEVRLMRAEALRQVASAQQHRQLAARMADGTGRIQTGLDVKA